MIEGVIQIAPKDVQPDGDTGALLAMVDVSRPEVAFGIGHGLGRVPVKAYVVESTGKFFNCFVIYKDRYQIQLVFNDSGGTALVRIV